tara:strand:+ start:4626 stop:5537 length:912 start_codon:yes stop_codon:yes gene_type:complete
MDLYNNELSQIKMYGQMRYEQANAHNERVSAMRRQASTEILQAKQGTQQEIAEENTEGMAMGGAASISTAIDANASKNAVKDHIKKKAEKALKNQVSQSVDSVAKKIKDPHGVPHDTKTMNPLTDTAKENEKMVARVSKAGLKEKLEDKAVAKMATKTGGRVLGAAGSFMNIGAGLKDFHDDMKGGSFHLEGGNDLEKASNALQMMSAVADVGGIYFAPLLAVGMLMGAASAVTGAIGEEEELSATEAKQKQQLQDKTTKINQAVGKLHTLDADKVRRQAIASIPKPDRPSALQQRTTTKVAG